MAAMLAPASAMAAKTGDAPVDNELEKYWNVELAVPTTENPMHERAGRFEASIGTGVLPNDSFFLGIPLTARAAMHLSDSVAIEAGFSYVLMLDSDLHNFLKTAGKAGLLQNVKKPPQLYMLGSIDLVYSPFHGKVGVFASKLSSFDIGIMIGAGVIGVNVDKQPTAESDALVGEIAPAGHWGATLRFYLSQTVAVRWDYRQFAYQPEDAMLFPIEFTLSASFLL